MRPPLYAIDSARSCMHSANFPWGLLPLVRNKWSLQLRWHNACTITEYTWMITQHTFPAANRHFKSVLRNITDLFSSLVVHSEQLYAIVLNCIQGFTWHYFFFFLNNVLELNNRQNYLIKCRSFAMHWLPILQVFNLKYITSCQPEDIDKNTPTPTV